MDFPLDDNELIPFSNAASRVYTEITGDFLSPFGDPAMRVLHDMAKLICSLVTIYGATGDESLKPLPVLELRQGTFQRGASAVRTNNGIEYRRLYIRRGDFRAAVAALKRFDAALN